MSFFTLQNGEKLYYEITGEGEHTVLMLHGWTSSTAGNLRKGEMYHL